MTELPPSTAPAPAPAPKLGRKRDHTRDPEILMAALEVLAETGYDGMTIDMVAARARAGKATLYRRWSSKGEMLIDAVASMKQGDPTELPDTGSLRGDLIAMIKQPSIEDGRRKLQIMAGIMSMVSQAPELAAAAHAAILAPRTAANRALLARAVARGEISAQCDVENLAMVSQSMSTYRVLILRQAVDRDFLVSIIDGVILPAAGMGIRSPDAPDTGPPEGGTPATGTSDASTPGV